MHGPEAYSPLYTNLWVLAAAPLGWEISVLAQKIPYWCACTSVQNLVRNPDWNGWQM